MLCAPRLLKGNVLEPRALDELIPEWAEKGAPVGSPVTEDSFGILTQTQSYRVPNFMLPAQLVSISIIIDRKGETERQSTLDDEPCRATLRGDLDSFLRLGSQVP